MGDIVVATRIPLVIQKMTGLRDNLQAAKIAQATLSAGND